MDNNPENQPVDILVPFATDISAAYSALHLVNEDHLYSLPVELSSVQDKARHILNHLLGILVDLQYKTQQSIGQATAMEKADLEAHYLVEIVHQHLGSGTPTPNHLNSHQNRQ